jgi:8-demethyl-8-alpha-L-rhamnosyltetracenomycin-C 2'-O-methyltransferase
MWRDFFPGAIIFGADVDPKTMFSEERIKTLQVNQLDKEGLGEALLKLEVREIDILIDDGHHSTEAHLNTIEAFTPFLSDGGSIFIEDVSADHVGPLVQIAKEKGLWFSLVQLRRRGLTLSNNQIFWVQKK